LAAVFDAYSQGLGEKLLREIVETSAQD